MSGARSTGARPTHAARGARAAPAHRAKASGALVALALGVGSSACVGVPSPLAPGLRGSVGVPHHGVLTDGVALPQKGDGFVRLRTDDVKWGNPRLVRLLTHAASTVKRARGGPPLVIADLAKRGGGKTPHHRSHRSGRDVDLLLFALTPQGVPQKSPGFVRFGADGLGKADGRWVRFDVPRTWALVKALLLAPEGHVQWIFVARWLEALVIEYASARGEDEELVWMAESVLLQPGDSAPHDDHLHLRIACTPEEAVAGCEGGGPYWPWLPPVPRLGALRDADLADLPPLLLAGATRPAPLSLGPAPTSFVHAWLAAR
jgi:penicillin-insensitive murein endopeptidase